MSSLRFPANMNAKLIEIETGELVASQQFELDTNCIASGLIGNAGGEIGAISERCCCNFDRPKAGWIYGPEAALHVIDGARVNRGAARNQHACSLLAEFGVDGKLNCGQGG